jgi:hypothetical protein
VTVDSLHVEVTGERLTEPPEFTRLTNTVSVACETWPAVNPDGNVLRSNWSSAVLPLPTYRLASVPRLVVERVRLTCASPVRATSVARATELVKNVAIETATRRPIEQRFKRTLLLRSMLTDKKVGKNIPPRQLSVDQRDNKTQCRNRWKASAVKHGKLATVEATQVYPLLD